MNILDSIVQLRDDLKTWTANNLKTKVDKVDGKGLSTNDYTTEEKEALAKNTTDIANLESEVEAITPVRISQAEYDALPDEEKDSDTIYYIYDADVNDNAFTIPFTSENYTADNVGDALNEVLELGDSGVELTQAEYDALPDSKYTDNVNYYITDVDTNSNAFTIPFTSEKFTAENVGDALNEVFDTGASQLKEDVAAINTQLSDKVLPQYKRFKLSSIGWYRIAEFKGMNAMHVAGAWNNGCDIDIRKLFEISPTENHNIKFRANNSNGAKFLDEVSSGLALNVTKIRFGYDATTFKGHIEIYYNNDASNSLLVQLSNQISVIDNTVWNLIEPVVTEETVEGFTIITTHEFSQNKSYESEVDKINTQLSTQLNNTIIPQYKNYMFPATGWYRVAKVRNNYQYMIDLQIIRTFANTGPELHKISICNNTGSNFKFLNEVSASLELMHPKVRVTQDSEHAHYIEVYCDHKSDGNNTVIMLSDQINSSLEQWSLVDAVATEETVEGITVLGTHEFSINKSYESEIDAVNEKVTTYPFGNVNVLSTEEEIDSYYNTVSAEFDITNTHYTRITQHAINTSLFYGGNYFLEGFKTDDNYEWQKITRYSDSGEPTKFERSKISGVWTAWVDTSYRDDITALQTSVNKLKYEWATPIKCATWQRLCRVARRSSITGAKYLINIECTRNGIVRNDTFLVTTHHKRWGNIIKLSGDNYGGGALTSVSQNYDIRIVVNDAGDAFFEINDYSNSATSATTQTITCSLIPISAGDVTTFVSGSTDIDGTTIPEGFGVADTMTVITSDFQSDVTDGKRDIELMTLSNGDVLDTTLKNGHYYCGNALNTPTPSSTSGYLDVEARDTSYRKHTWRPYNSNEVYENTCIDGTWKGWEQLAKQSDLHALNHTNIKYAADTKAEALAYLDNPTTIEFIGPNRSCYNFHFVDTVGDSPLGGGVTMISGYTYGDGLNGAQIALKYTGTMKVRYKKDSTWSDWKLVGDATYKDISDSIDVGDTGCTARGYIENGCIALYILIPTGSTGTIPLSIDTAYAPRFASGGSLASLSTASDIGKVMGNVLGDGTIGLYISGTLAANEIISFTYPLKTS